MTQIAENKVSYENKVEGKRTGKAPAKSHPLMLSASDYLKADIVIPKKFVRKGLKIPISKDNDYGNDTDGCCTIASQVIAAIRMELQETRRLTSVSREEILRVYYNMTKRLYGGGDVGAFEIDALSNWRNPDLTFRDKKGNPLTIDAYTRVNNTIINDVKKAIVTAPAHSVKVCFNLPTAWEDTLVWDIPEDQKPIGKWLAGSWGGHSMADAEGYDEKWLYVNHTWSGCGIGKVSWKAVSIYLDECNMFIDSIDSWKKRLGSKFKASKLISDVNNVSDLKIK